MNITIDIVLNNLDKPWNWTSLTDNYSLGYEIFKKYTYLPWNWSEVSKRYYIPHSHQYMVHFSCFLDALEYVHD